MRPTRRTIGSRLLRLLPAAVLRRLDGWSARVAQRRAERRRALAMSEAPARN